MRDLRRIVLLPHVLLEFLHGEEVPCVFFDFGGLFAWIELVAIIFVLTVVLSFEGKSFPKVDLAEGSFAQLAEPAVLVLKGGVIFLGAGHMTILNLNYKCIDNQTNKVI